MKTTIITGECESCDSTYDVEYMEELASKEIPMFCPFCGEEIEEIIVNYDEDDLDRDSMNEYSDLE